MELLEGQTLSQRLVRSQSGINTSATTLPGQPRLSSDLPHYAVTADGQRFIMIQAAEAGWTIQVVDHAIPR